MATPLPTDPLPMKRILDEETSSWEIKVPDFNNVLPHSSLWHGFVTEKNKPDSI